MQGPGIAITITTFTENTRTCHSYNHSHTIHTSQNIHGPAITITDLIQNMNGLVTAITTLTKHAPTVTAIVTFTEHAQS